MRDSWRQAGRGRLFPVLLLALGLIVGLSREAVAAPRGDYAPPEVLIQPEELKPLLVGNDDNLRIIDFRHKAKYYLGHIPGAVQVWRPETEDRRRSGPAMPTAAQLEKLLGRVGITAQHTLIIYSDQCDHARLWWLLAYYGFPLNRMKLLDGGLEAWKGKGYPTELTSPRRQPTTFKFPPQGVRKYLLANLAEVKEARTRPQSLVLDVRAEDLFRGRVTREGAARPGHIPGAVWVFWEQARHRDGPYKGFWKSAQEIKAIYAAQGVTPEQDIYLYSHTDRCAAHSLVSLYLAGFPLEKLHVYAGSWVEWSRSGEPVSLEPTVAKKPTGKE